MHLPAGMSAVVAMVSFRLGQADGVSVAASHWASALGRLGFRVRTVAGEGRADHLVPGLGLHPRGDRLSFTALQAVLGRADLVVVENVCSLPLNPAAMRLVSECLRGRPAILHHHDLPWQRARFVHVEGWPPDDPAWIHVAISERSRGELAARGIEAVTVYNGFPEEPPGRRGPTRRRLGIRRGDLLLLQPTRAIPRKQIGAGVALAEALGATYWLTGPAEEGFGPAADRILAGARGPVRRGLPAGLTMADAYAAADAVVLPSSWEGFGCPLIESALHRRPLAVADYPVAAEIARFGFRWFPVDDPRPLRAWLAHRDGGLIEWNHELARRHFSLDALTATLARLLRAARQARGWGILEPRPEAEIHRQPRDPPERPARRVAAPRILNGGSNATSEPGPGAGSRGSGLLSDPSSLELAQRAVLRPIEDVAAEAGLRPEEVEPFGRHAAKVDLSVLDRLAGSAEGRLVVVTGITPTSLGEGKTTTSIGLAQGLERVGARALLCLREPSVGPVFGAKGGGTGGGHAQVVPMEDINLHFTGDFHAVAAAHNLLAAALDASLHHGNPLGIEPRSVTWPRALDVNDRALRHIEVGLGGKAHGVPRESGFVITAASEVMAILALSSGLADLRQRLGRIVVGETGDGRPVTAEDLRAAGAMAVLLRHAIQPNLAQTIEGRPALIHTGPFGNIASGNSSVIADQVALRLADVVVTEAGFGSDLGFEKLCHLVAPASGIVPSAAMIVATIRALRMHGGLDEVTARAGPDAGALERGSANLAAHIDNVHAFGVSAVVAVNRVEGDTDAELDLLAETARDLGADEVAVCDGFARGGAGAEDLAKAVLAALERPATFAPLNPAGTPVRDQIERIATRLYGADGVELSPTAERALARLAERGLDRLPVCMAKSHLSLSHDPGLKGRPRGFTLPVRDLVASVGAGFLVALCGDQLLMPGLGREPAFTRMDVDAEGRVVGLS